MSSLIKLLLGIVGLVVVLAIAAALAVALLVDPNDYRDDIARAVERQTGRQLTIAGELSLDFLPCCGIALGRTSLSNPAGFAEPQFASVENVRLGLQVWPLIARRELLLGEISLTGLNVALLRTADGRANWEFDTAAEGPEAPEPPASAGDVGAESGESGGMALKSLSVAGVNISESRLSLVDESADVDLTIDEFELFTGSIEPGEPFDLESSLRVTDKSAQNCRERRPEHASRSRCRRDHGSTGRPEAGIVCGGARTRRRQAAGNCDRGGRHGGRQ